MALALLNPAILPAYIPHGHCYLWKPGLVGLHLVSDALIAFAYYSIPITLLYFVRKRQDLPFPGTFILFAAFIIACGTTHLMAIWTLWHPTYWVSGALKAITAFISVLTALMLLPIIPKALALPSPAQLEAVNSALQQEIAERKRIEKERDGFFNLSPDLLCITTFDGYFQYVNPAWETETGFTTEELLAHPYIDVIYPEDHAALAADAQKVMTGIDTANHESRIQCKAGSVKWISWSASAAPEGKLIYVVGRNITERKQAELAVARLAAIVESSSDAIISKSLEGTITSWNASAEKLFGYTAAEAIGRSIAMLFPPDRADEFSQILEQIQRGEAIESYETVRVRQDGQRIETEVAISPIKDVRGQVIGAAKITRDISARKQTAAALRESESRFQTFMDNSPAAAWITDAAGRMLYRSQTYSRLFQVPDEVVGKTVSELYAPETAARFLHHNRQVLETDRPVEAIAVAPRPDGTLGEFLVYKFPIHESSGQRVVGGVAVDVTEREQAKKALRSLNERLQYLLTNAPVVIFSCKVDGNYGVTSVSENVRTLLGHEPQAFLEDSDFWATHLHPEDRDRIFANVPQVFATGYHTHEYRFLHGDGDYHWVYAQLQLMRDAVGNPTEMIGYLIDISDRKQTETALRQSEVRNRALVQAMPDLLIRMKQDGTYLDIQKTGNVPLLNPTLMFTGNDIYAILPADKAHERMGHVQQALQTRALQVYEYQLKVDGKLQFEEARIVPCGEDEVLVIVRDITERKQTEEALRRYERIVSATTDAILLIDRNYIYQVVNQAYLNWYDKRQDEIVGHAIIDVLPQELFESTVKPRLDQCLAGQVLQFELWASYPNLGQQFLSVTYDPYFDKNQSITGVVVSLRNITKLKQAEVKLELQSIIVKNMAEGVCMVKVSDGTFVYANPKFEQMFGYDTGELMGRHVSVVNYEDRTTHPTELYEELTRTILEQGEATYEIHNVKKDGTPFWCQATTSVFEHPQYGAVFVVVQQDITDRKQAEDNLRALSNRLTLALKSGAIGTWAWDITANRLTWDDRMYELYGITPDQSTNSYETWANGVHPDDRPLAEAATQQALAGEQDYEPEFRVVQPDGTIRYLAAHALVQRDTEGQPLHMIGVNIDISERKQAEGRLKLQSIILKNMAGGVCLVRTGDGGIAYTNPKFERMFGYDPGELDGRDVSILNYQYDQVDANEVAQTLMATIQEQGEFTYEVHNVKKDGTPFWCQGTASVLEHPEYGTVMVAVQHDISDRKRAEAERQILMLNLQQSNQELEQFAFIASHDLREPLRTIRSFCSLLQSRHQASLNEKGQDYLNRIQNATQRMQALVDDLLSLSQVSTQAKPFLPVDLAKVVQEVTSGLQKQLQQTGGRVEVENLPTVLADSTQLSQLFQNLISNALKFHRDVAPMVKISSQLQPATGNASDSGLQQILVEDNGIGFDQKHSDRVFEAFERLHGRGKYEGTGIGLAICRKIVERHGGSITVRSLPGHGSTFIITLPIH